MLIQDLWFDEQAFKAQILGKNTIETRIKCEILDMPGIYHMQDEDFQQLFESLAETDQSEIFNRRAVRKLIEFNYP